ncbi:MAG TPA: hypothetical protein VNS08_13125 [Ureibacillus sp.]|nr:hypothetical protein [Ureibacillus sp.]
MNYFICDTCGIQYDQSLTEPSECKICTEERQFVSVSGQTWTTLERLVASNDFNNNITFEEDGLYSIKTVPTFAIGQHAYIIQNKDFNVLWDCITYLDKETIAHINLLGGIQAIALSHPHYYSSQVEWAEAFDAPIYIHEDDQEWITRPSDRIILWSGEELVLQEGLILHRVGGHFKGATVLEWQNPNKVGTLFVGDIIRVVADHDWVTFMYSYPNFIPLPAATVKRMAHQMKSLHFERIFDAFHRSIDQHANKRVQLSAERYIAALENKLFET